MERWRGGWPVVQEAAELAGSIQGRGDPPGDAARCRRVKGALWALRDAPAPHPCGCPMMSALGVLAPGVARARDRSCSIAGIPAWCWEPGQRRGPSVGCSKPRCSDGFMVAAWPGASSRQTLRLDSRAVATPSPGSCSTPYAGWVPSGCSRAEGLGPAPGMSRWDAAVLAVPSTSLLPSA